MLWRVFQALFSVLMIIGGLSGQWVLRGTNSGPALAVFGALWLVYDIYSIVTYLKRKDGAGSLPAQLSELQVNSKLDDPCTITITRDSNIVGSAVKHAIYVNETYIGDLKNGGSITAETQYKVNIVTSQNLPGKLIFEASGHEPVNLRFLAVADKKRQNLEIVSGATEIGALEGSDPATSSKKEKKQNKGRMKAILYYASCAIWVLFIIGMAVALFDEIRFGENNALITIALCGLPVTTAGVIMLFIKKKAGLIVAVAGTVVTSVFAVLAGTFIIGVTPRFDTAGFIGFMFFALVPIILMLPQILINPIKTAVSTVH